MTEHLAYVNSEQFWSERGKNICAHTDKHFSIIKMNILLSTKPRHSKVDEKEVKLQIEF